MEFLLSLTEFDSSLGMNHLMRSTGSMHRPLLLISIGVTSLIGADYYVAPPPLGKTSNSGLSAESPWPTVNRAAAVVNPGDTVHLADGTYNESVYLNRSGTADAYITFVSTNRWGAKLVSNTGSNGFTIDGNFIEIDGVDLTNPGGHGINGEGNHHIRVRNCHLHHCGNSGFSGGFSDFYLIEDNVCNNNANLSWYSGISIYEAKSIGDSSAGPHIIIRNNICYSNLTAPAAKLHTDGNGIICDDWNYTQNPGTPYPFYGLVENNICYNNGGAGIKSSWCDNIVFRNNIVFKNNTDTFNPGTYRGDLYCQDSRNTIWVNNIAWGDPALNANNTAMMDKGAPSGKSNVANIWQNNLFFNGTNGAVSQAIGDGSSPVLTGNINGVNPLFDKPGLTDAADFHLQSGSPAINAGSSTYGIPAADIEGKARPVGSAVDIGSYEFGSTIPINHPPVADAKSVSLAEDTEKTITLTGNDSDGDALTFNVITYTLHGTLAGILPTLRYVPDLNNFGADSFTYRVNDGVLDSPTVTVSLTITPVNDAPVQASPIPARSAIVDSVFSYTLPNGTFLDVEGDALTWSTDEQLAWLNFDPATHSFSGTPTNSDVGVKTITVSVTDGSATANVPFVLTVNALTDTTPPATPAAPTISSSSPTPIISGKTEPGATISIFDDANLIATVSVDATGTWSYLKKPAFSPGLHIITVHATDGAGNISATSPSTNLSIANDGGTSANPASDTTGGGGCGLGTELAILFTAGVFLMRNQRCL